MIVNVEVMMMMRRDSLWVSVLVLVMVVVISVGWTDGNSGVLDWGRGGVGVGKKGMGHGGVAAATNDESVGW